MTERTAITLAIGAAILLLVIFLVLTLSTPRGLQ